MTGRRPLVLLVQTLRARQSSPTVNLGIVVATSGISVCGPCGASSPNSKASLTPVHDAGFTGGMKRLAPDVGAPYRMPLNAFTLSTTKPRILPDVVSTVSPGFASAAHALLLLIIKAAAPVPINVRRFILSCVILCAPY